MKVKELFATGTALQTLKAASTTLRSWDLTPEQLCDLELLLNGAFAPLDGFMSQSETQTVLTKKSWRGQFWPLPIVLDVSEAFANSTAEGDAIALRDQEGVLIAVLNVSDKFASTDVAAHSTARDWQPICLGGAVTGVEAPMHHDFQRLRLTPKELCSQFTKLGWRKVLGFATKRPLHQAEVNETYNTAREIEANLLLNPAVGAISPEDDAHYARVHCYSHVLAHYPSHTTDLALLPLNSSGIALDDVLLHALALKNQGCTHYMVDSEYVPAGSSGLNYSQLQETLSAYNDKLGIALTFTDRMVHSSRQGGYVKASEVAEDEVVDSLTSAEFHERLRKDLAVPAWFSYPQVVNELRKVFKPCAEQGVTIFFTGLSGSGKSSIANAVLVKMMEMGGRPITLLDGDIVRQNLSSELGFSREHRDLNIRRIGYVASEITKHGGMAICAPIAPYADTRRVVRDMIERVGGFVEVHVATSLAICEARDRKGLYAKARAGIIKEFTGISDPYEEPKTPELRIDTDGITPELAAQRVILTLGKLGYIKSN